jgi:hypothetical protein
MPIWDGSNGDTRKASMTTLLAYISANFADPDYTTRIVAPAASGWNVDVGDTGTSMWLIINPVADYALGSISLPPATSAADGQEITVSITQKVTAFSATSSGATVTGLPATLLSYAVFILRYNAEKLTWYAVEGANSVSSLVSYTATGTGAVPRDVQGKLEESVSIVDYGADYTGNTDSTAAIQKALNASASVHCPPGNFKFSTPLSLNQRQKLTGSGKVATTFTYTGSGQAFVNTSGGRLYDVTVRDIYFNDEGTGTDCFYLEDFSNAHFERVDVNGFDRAFVLATTVSPTNNALYNRFLHCYVGNCGTAWDLLEDDTAGGSSSGANSTTIAWSRANVCTNAVKIANSNDVTIMANQFEAGVNGVVLTDTVGGVNNRTRIMYNRFESNSGVDINIGADVSETFLCANYYVDTATRLIDLGTRTQDMDLYGPDWEFRLTNPYATSGGGFQFERTAAAPASEPMMTFTDSNAGSGTPVTVEINTARVLGKPVKVRNCTKGSIASIADAGSVAVTFTDTGDLVNYTSHPYFDGALVRFATIVSTTGIAVDTNYYVVSSLTNSFQVSATKGGSALALTTNGSGTIPNIRIATGTHGLSAGEVTELREDTGYDRSYAVTNVSDTTHFDVTATFVATGTGHYLGDIVELFNLTGQGRIGTNQGTANTNTPSGATANQLPIYDEAGTLLGYIPIYAAAW